MNTGSSADVSPRPWLLRAVLLSAVAGLIHALVAPSHFEEWVGYGLFFVVASAAQLIYAAWLALKPGRLLLWAGIAGNAAIFALWLVTRTVGIPFFGPHAGEVEPLGVPDIISKLVEVALIVHLAILLRHLPRRELRPLVH